ncbi:helix-turn-helix domain-containing protein [Mesorhizobium muleiense]|uniref:helix-turn-helix domain-containing protein n=1 Tax=Mesorhizobium muleiense TaxID=1004279 RepID=UPI000B842A2A|nr:helix-turn-helix transcriptional regulator [Mesorhizobium muleiense]MCF6100530.1 helix-turn-helix domain-containing protein [Mesorhizobium muleiense]
METQLAANLRLLCSTHRSVSEVCRRLGFNRQQFARYLTGETQPSHHNLRRIASAFGVTIDELLRPASDFEASVRSKGLSTQVGLAKMIDRAFPGDIQKLRPLLGYYHMHFLVPHSSGTITRSLIHIYERDGKVCSKTIERSGPDEIVQRLSKYEGLLSYLGNCIFLLEFETLSCDSIVESMLFPSYRRKLDVLTGLTFGVTSQVYRQPFASPIAWKYLGNVVDIKEQLRACARFPKEDRRIDPRIRKYLESAGSTGTLSSTPF